LEVVFAVFVSAFATSCGGDLSRHSARNTLQDHFSGQFKSACFLSPALPNKPEFQALKEAAFCKEKVRMTGIQISSATARHALYDVVTDWDPAQLKRWLESFDQFHVRLSGPKIVPASVRQSYWQE
jgi:hypothetical protein